MMSLRGTFLQFPITSEKLTLWAVRGYFMLAMWALKRCGFQGVDLFYRNNKDDAELDVIIAWRTEVLRSTYADYTDVEGV